jgi:hypothetical protein
MKQAVAVHGRIARYALTLPLQAKSVVPRPELVPTNPRIAAALIAA